MENDFSKSIKAIYTDLDTLFDTRAVFLAALSDQGRYDIKIFGDNNITNYFNRYRDNFGTISAWMFHYYYKHRTANLLTHADLTNIPKFISDYILDSLTSATKDTEAKVFVNTHPYNLSTDETMVILSILNNVFNNVDIIFINVPFKEIKPSWLVEKNIGMMVAYEITEWLNYQIESNNGLIEELVNVRVLAPFILQGIIKDKDVTPDLVEELSMFFRVTCDFAFLPAKEFCLVQHKA